jgi:hypothetical protein
MKILKYSTLVLAATALLTSSSCKKALDINTSPNLPSDAPINTLYSGAATSVGFVAGSDFSRFSSLIMQQFAGQTTGSLTQTQQWAYYLIAPTDGNTLWSNCYSNVLVNLDLVVQKAGSTSPHYAGVAKLLEAYTYSLMVDTWGDIPYSESLKLTANLQPHYDAGQTIYTSLLSTIDAGIADVNAASSSSEVPDSSPIYPGAFSKTKAQWVKFGNTLKLRLLLHESKKNAAAATALNTLLSSGAQFLASNDDNFNGNFTSTPNAQNPIYQFDQNRVGYIVANKFMVDIMNGNNDPRRATYFTDFPAGSGKYVGSASGDDPSADFSSLGTYLEGQSGEAPVRMLTFAEYNFIRAEAALTLGSPGTAQTFFQAGITASMQDAGVAAGDITTYIAAHGTLAGTPANQLQQIITEKYLASFGIAVEQWSDWRRTGYPAISVVKNAVVPFIPRSLYYPETETDLNPNAKQKSGLDARVFWDAQ